MDSAQLKHFILLVVGIFSAIIFLFYALMHIQKRDKKIKRIEKAVKDYVKFKNTPRKWSRNEIIVAWYIGSDYYSPNDESIDTIADWMMRNKSALEAKVKKLQRISTMSQLDQKIHLEVTRMGIIEFYRVFSNAITMIKHTDWQSIEE